MSQTAAPLFSRLDRLRAERARLVARIRDARQSVQYARRGLQAARPPVADDCTPAELDIVLAALRRCPGIGFDQGLAELRRRS